MMHNSSNTTESDEIVFTAAYGTTVATTGAHPRTIRGHEREGLAESSDNITRDVAVAAAADQD